MRATPAASASRGVPNTARSPSSHTSPASGRCTPARIFMRVLLPAPFSPISASTSPRCSTRSTPCNAWTPGKALPMPRTSSSGAPSTSLACLAGLLLQVLPERVDVRLLDRARRHVEEAVLLQQRCTRLGSPRAHELGQQLHRAVAVVVRVLHDRAGDRAVEDALQRRLVLVERDHRDLAEPARGLHRVED